MEFYGAHPLNGYDAPPLRRAYTFQRNFAGVHRLVKGLYRDHLKNTQPVSNCHSLRTVIRPQFVEDRGGMETDGAFRNE